jgi:4-amino-4-deoxy-L-arabinose transferase-like glycosyltransferase
MSRRQTRQPGEAFSRLTYQPAGAGRRPVVNLLVAFLLALFAVQAFTSALQKSNTWDESGHLLCGYAHLKQGMDWLEPSHPPFGRALAAAPLLLFSLDNRLEEVRAQDAADSNFYSASLSFLFENCVPGETLLAVCRLMVILLGVVLGLYVYRWAHLLYGLKGGLLALFLYSLSPTILAHARLITTDFPATAMAFIALYHFWSFTRQPALTKALVAGLFLGLALATKYNTVFVLIPMVSWALWALALGRQKTMLFASRSRLVVGLLAVGAAAHLAIWGVYELHGRPPLTPQQDRAAVYRWEKYRPSSVHLAAALDACRRAHILPESYLFGLRRLLARGREGHQAYLLGRISNTGWWYYFLMAFLVKTQVSVLLLLFAALLFFVKIKDAAWTSLNFLLLPAVAIFFFTSRQHIDIGLRHVLPAYPFLLVFIARLVHYKTQHQTLAGWVLGLLCIWTVWETALIYPHYLAYFNGLVGGPRGGCYVLVDSNLDWGQDLKGLKSYMERNGIEKVKLGYFGMSDPAYYGVAYELLPSYVVKGRPMCQAESQETLRLQGTVAVSATLLQGLYCPGDVYRVLRLQPTATIGYSIYVFRFS